jgi:hypothetical protein
MSVLIDSKLKPMISEEARNSLKPGSTSLSLNQEPLSLLTLQAERKKKTVNTTFKG